MAAMPQRQIGGSFEMMMSRYGNCVKQFYYHESPLQSNLGSFALMVQRDKAHCLFLLVHAALAFADRMFTDFREQTKQETPKSDKMGYDLYVITMRDQSWRFVPYTHNAQNRISTFYMKGDANESLDLAKENIDEDDGDIKSWQHVGKVREQDFVKAQDAMNLAFTMDMSRHQDVHKMGEEVDWSTVERYGSWSQTFIMLALKRMEREKVVKEGTVEKFKEMI